MALVVADQTAVTRALRWMQSAMPTLLQRLIFSTPQVVRFPGGQKPVSGRSVCLALDSGLVLRRRLTLPKRAKRHLGGAVRLLVETETPFSTGELLLHADQLEAAPAAGDIAYELRMVPRAMLHEASRELGIAPGRIVRITEFGADERVDFFAAAFPSRRIVRWSPVLPLLLLIASGGALAFQVLDGQRTQIAAVETAAAATLSELRSVAKKIEMLRGGMAGELAVTQALESSPSAYSTLQEVRKLLPADAQLVRLQLQHGELRLALKARDVLAISQLLAEPSTSPPWSSKIEGAITVDAGSGLEQATILLRVTPKASVE
jgi:hypothetical protein